MASGILSLITGTVQTFSHLLFDVSGLSASRTATWPNKSGTVAMLDDITSLNFAYAAKTDTASNLTTGERETGLQVAITPTSETSKILVWGMANISGNGYGVLQLKDDSTYLLRGDAAGSRVRGLAYINCAVGALSVWPTVFCGVYTPGVTTERTIKLIWHKQGGDDFYLNRSRTDIDSSTYYLSVRLASILIAMEIP